jgi:hypothetical protein
MGQPAHINVSVIFNDDKSAIEALYHAESIGITDSEKTNNHIEENKLPIEQGHYNIEDASQAGNEIDFVIYSDRYQNAEWQNDNMVKLMAKFGAVEYSSQMYISADGDFFDEDDLNEMRKKF